jgi:hypothetical protein
MSQYAHLFTVFRYVLRNPVRAGLVKPALSESDWPTSHCGTAQLAVVD